MEEKIRHREYIQESLLLHQVTELERRTKILNTILPKQIVMGNFPDMKNLTLYMEGDCHIFSKISEKRLIPKHII